MWGTGNALMSVFKGNGRVFSFVAFATVTLVMRSCKAGDGAAGRRLTFSDARIGYRLSGFRPGLSHSYSGHRLKAGLQASARECPTVAPSPAMHNEWVTWPASRVHSLQAVEAGQMLMLPRS